MNLFFLLVFLQILIFISTNYTKQIFCLFNLLCSCFLTDLYHCMVHISHVCMYVLATNTTISSLSAYCSTSITPAAWVVFATSGLLLWCNPISTRAGENINPPQSPLPPPPHQPFKPVDIPAKPFGPLKLGDFKHLFSIFIFRYFVLPTIIIYDMFHGL